MKFLLFLLAVFVQMLVVSTGNLFSPFLIVIHLFALGVGFLFTVPASLSFLLLTVGILLLNTQIDANAHQAFTNDPGTAMLYAASFAVIIPVTILVNRLYHLKDSLVNILDKEVQSKVVEQKSLLEGLSELVFVVDRDLNIISANEAAERVLVLSNAEMVHHPFLKTVYLKNNMGEIVTVQTLGIANVLAEKKTFITKNINLYVKNTSKPLPVSIRVQPIANIEGAVNELAIILDDPSATTSRSAKGHSYLEEARVKHQVAISDLRQKLMEKGMDVMGSHVEVLRKAEQDVMDAIEVEHHSISPRITLVDVAQLCDKSVLAESEFAKAFHTKVVFEMINFGEKDIAPLVPQGFKISPMSLTSAFFTAPVDIKWFSLLVQKLIDLAILMASSQKEPLVKVGVERAGLVALVIKVSTASILTVAEQQEVFQQYYGILSDKTNLKRGSGLEGYMAKMLADILKITLEIESVAGTQTIFKLTVNKA